jgi:hypothetical protein
MELIFAHQVGFNQLKNKKFNYFFAASGYENRCTYLIDNISIDADKKIVFAFDDKKDFLFRIKNDKRFSEEGFTFIEESANSIKGIHRLLNDICNNLTEREEVNLLIDYSCMSKVWYAGILQFFISNEPEINNLEVYFSYTSAAFSEPLEPEPRILLSTPVNLLKSNSLSKKPLALIIGLGYEKFLTRSVMDKLEYHIMYAFYSDPAFDNRYVERVIENNQKVLRQLPKDQIYRYPVEDFKKPITC